jgi:hypothetical protein
VSLCASTADTRAKEDHRERGQEEDDDDENRLQLFFLLAHPEKSSEVQRTLACCVYKVGLSGGRERKLSWCMFYVAFFFCLAVVVVERKKRSQRNARFAVRRKLTVSSLVHSFILILHYFFLVFVVHIYSSSSIKYKALYE